MKRSDSKIRHIGMAIFLCMGMAWTATAALASAPPADSGTVSAPQARELYRASGLQAEEDAMAAAELPTEAFTNPLTLLFVGMPESQVNLVNRIYEGAFDAREFYGAILRRFESHYDSKKGEEALRWFDSPGGQKAIALESQFLNEYLKVISSGMEPLATYRENRTKDDLPSGERLALIARLAKAKGLVRHDFSMMESILKVVAPLNNYFHTRSASEMVEKMKEELPDYMKTIRVIFLFRIYEGLTQAELQQMVQFFESPAGQWFRNNQNMGGLDGQSLMNQKAKGRLETVLKALEEGQHDKELFKAIFPPGLRHMFTRSRDPFMPLVVIQGEVEDESDTVAPTERFGEELADLTPIPYEHYQNLKEIDPALYDDLEFYASLFRDRTELEKLEESEYKEEVEQYKRLIQRATSLMEDEILTPLQEETSALTLVGTLESTEDRLALVQTADKKGHTVRKGMVIGPRFGVVEEITADGILIIERMRDFEGNIMSEESMLEFPSTE